MTATQTSFVAELESKNLHPLWDRYQRITPIRPQPKDTPEVVVWRQRMKSERGKETYKQRASTADCA